MRERLRLLGRRVNDFPGANVTLAEQWNGSDWSIVTTPNPSPSVDNLSAVACTGASDCWAVGFASAGLLVNTLAEHWNGSTWSIVTTPTRVQISQLSMEWRASAPRTAGPSVNLATTPRPWLSMERH